MNIEIKTRSVFDIGDKVFVVYDGPGSGHECTFCKKVHYSQCSIVMEAVIMSIAFVVSFSGNTEHRSMNYRLNAPGLSFGADEEQIFLRREQAYEYAEKKNRERV